MKRVLLILTLTLTLLLVLSAAAMAAEPATVLDSSGDQRGDGWRWDASEATLYLDGAENEGGFVFKQDSIVILDGENNISDADYGLYAFDYDDLGFDLTVKGQGSLDIEAGSCGIYVEDITIEDDAEIDIHIDASHSPVRLSNFYGIYAEYDITIDDAIVNVSFAFSDFDDAEKCAAYGLYSYDGDLYIINGSVVDIEILDKHEYLDYYCGIYLKYYGLLVEDSELNIDSTHDGIWVYDYDAAFYNSKVNIEAGVWGLDIYGDIVIKDQSDVEIDAGYIAIDSYGDITIEKSQVTAKGGMKYKPYHWMLEDYSYSVDDDEFFAEKADDYDGYGIRSLYGDISIDTSQVYAEGYTAAIAALWEDSQITIDNAVVVRGGRIADIYGNYDELYDDSSIAGATIDVDGQFYAAGDYYVGQTFSYDDEVKLDFEIYENEDGTAWAAISLLDDASDKVEIITKGDFFIKTFTPLMGVNRHFPFVDVPNDHWAYRDIDDAYARGLINGFDVIFFKPNDPLTYAEAIKMAACVHQLRVDGAVSLTNGNPWYAPYVEYAERQQIISPGQYSGKYKSAINRFDFAAIFANIPGDGLYGSINTISAIPDLAESSAYGPAVYKLYRAGVMTGDEQHKFNGATQMKRSEAAAIMMRVLDTERRVSFFL